MPRSTFEIIVRIAVVVSMCFSSFSPLIAQAAPNRYPAIRSGEAQVTDPVADFSATPLSGTTPLMVTFSNSSSDATLYEWDFGDGTSGDTDAAPTHTYTVSGVYTVTLAAGNGVVTDTLTRTNYINVSSPPSPQADFNATPLSGTAPLTVTFSNSSTNTTSYQWDFGDGATSTETSPNHTYTQSGIYTVTLAAGNGVATDTLAYTGYISVTEVTPPQADFSAAPLSGTVSLEVTFTNSSTNASSYEWDFGDGTFGSTAISPTHTYTQSGIYTVTLAAGNGTVTDTISRAAYISVTEPDQPQALFNAAPLSGVVPLEVTFTNNSTAATRYLWTFGDGTGDSTDINPTHTYLQSGIYTVTLAASNGVVTDTLSQIIDVSEQNEPDAQFIGEPVSGLVPLTITFTNSSTNATSYLWTFGDGTIGSTDINPTHIYTQSGNYTVTLTAGNGLVSDTLTRTHYITAALPVSTTFAAFPQNGPAPLLVQFLNNSSNADLYLWDFGDGQISTTASPTHTYTTPGVYTVTLTAANGVVSDTLVRPHFITVTTAAPPGPAAAFDGTPQTGPEPLSVTFTNNSTNATSYAWDFGDGTAESTDINPTHIYTKSGIYTVTLTAGDGISSDTLTKTGYITVSPLVGANFSATPRLGVLPLAVTFVNSSTNANSYQWDFGDGTSAFMPQLSPFVYTYTQAGIYSVTLVAGNGVSTDTLEQANYITVTPPVTAAFSAFPRNDVAPLTVQFFDNSVNATDYLWDFGDGTAGSTAVNPLHTYTNPGMYTATLSAGNGMVTDTLVQPYYITVTEEIVLNLPFTDGFESSSGNWFTEGDWALVTDTVRSGDIAVTDSPAGNYVHNSNTALILKDTLNLSGTVAPRLTFWDTYNLAAYDRAYVDVSTDSGQTWTAHEIHYYSSQPGWTKQTLDLSAYAGEAIKLRFRLDATNHVYTGDGWVIDNIIVEETPAPIVYTLPYSDELEDEANWEAEGVWGIVSDTVRSGTGAFADSPDGNYQHGYNTSLVSRFEINLSGAISPTLTFWDTYNLAAYDRAYVDVSTDSGQTWTAHQIHYYSSQPGWTKQTLDLSAYAGEAIKLRFRLDATNHVYTGDGWVIDNIIVEETPAPIVYTLPYSDELEDEANWEAEGVWGIVTDTVRSGTGAFADSPDGNYKHGYNTSLISRFELDLNGTVAPELSWWDIYSLSAYDYGYVEVSSDGGQTWAQVFNHYYSSHSSWQRQVVDLSDYVDQQIAVRFRLDATNHVYTADGWLIDKLEVAERSTISHTLPFTTGFENGSGNWFTEGEWALVTDSVRSGSFAVTESPAGNYLHNSNTSLTLKDTLNLSGTVAPRLTFWDTYALAAYDRAYVDVSTDHGQTWASHQIHYYSSQPGWTKQTVDLNAYAGEVIKLRFRLDAISHAYTGDGWVIDNIVVEETPAPTVYTL